MPQQQTIYMKNSRLTYVSKETKELSKEIKKFTAELAKDPKAAKAFLVAAGILTEKGNFRAPYRRLRTLQNQA
ncbi:hypothetical protein HHL17_30325 [Chitinophaga sp. G-6-1-13]|uniref:Uncharacterized protein n=1 Tax=Chitinophaga fulva TaxID=2728842 RepID=A0A848GW29_9BACT|nr:hypothetical protein [Chitinophaga fulva]NML41519.1 hypothetical protein [Chitinophaga fulva]